MLAVWPVVTMMLFILLPAHRALIWSVLGAYLVLPVSTAFELPGVPPLDKTTIPNLSILLCCILFVREKWLGALKDPAVVVLASTFVFSPFLTAFFNPEPLLYADRLLPAMTMYDAFAQAAINGITLIPFVAAYGLINSDQRRWHVIAILVTAALAYSVLMLIEVRLSPQLHRMVYGFFPHSFGQQMRGGGFRSVVFLGHGLLVAIFCSMAVTAAVARWRESRGRQRTRAGLIAIYFGVVLLLCKSFGAIILAVLFTPIVAFLRAKRVAAIGAAACIILLLYPAIRSTGLVPTVTISELTKSFSTDRAGSLGVRLVNEDQLLKRAAEKPMFGWGSWGRNRIYSPEDGKDLSITDGAWIITLGMWGWAGYLAMFGLFCLGSVRLWWRSRTHSTISIASASLCLLLSMNLLDSIPNASVRPVTWLIAGAIFAVGAKKSGRTKIDAADRQVGPSLISVG
ncbi:MAG: hypothetical protein KKA44_11655 [Alphaproteobacteria bacterium]|nr:hypothetical protein [Alphaproteobacteria bacterium]